eukprot:m.496218 g.496218  ORF g.496218 m.496218 type:complete len:621 (-) comp21808_c0_seq3:518-2380(-)
MANCHSSPSWSLNMHWEKFKFFRYSLCRTQGSHWLPSNVNHISNLRQHENIFRAKLTVQHRYSHANTIFPPLQAIFLKRRKQFDHRKKSCIRVMCDSESIATATAVPKQQPVPTQRDNPIRVLTEICTQQGYRLRYNLNIKSLSPQFPQESGNVALASITVQYSVHTNDDCQTFELPPIKLPSKSLQKHEKRRIKESIYRVALTAVKRRAHEDVPLNTVRMEHLFKVCFSGEYMESSEAAWMALRSWSERHPCGIECAVGIDCEGVMSTPPKLVQIAMPGLVIFEFPWKHSPPRLSDGLLTLLEDKSITKVFCDQKQDMAALKSGRSYHSIADLHRVTKTRLGLARVTSLAVTGSATCITKSKGGAWAFINMDNGKTPVCKKLSDLSTKAQSYGAMDAWMTLHAYYALMKTQAHLAQLSGQSTENRRMALADHLRIPLAPSDTVVRDPCGNAQQHTGAENIAHDATTADDAGRAVGLPYERRRKHQTVLLELLRNRLLQLPTGVPTDASVFITEEVTAPHGVAGEETSTYSKRLVVADGSESASTHGQVCAHKRIRPAVVVTEEVVRASPWSDVPSKGARMQPRSTAQICGRGNTLHFTPGSPAVIVHTISHYSAISVDD